MESVSSSLGGIMADHALGARSNSGLLAQARLSPNEVAQEFESLFISQLVKEMRETVGEEGMFAGSADAYGGLFDMFMGSYLAKSGGLGLHRFISEYLEPPDVAKPQA